MWRRKPAPDQPAKAPLGLPPKIRDSSWLETECRMPNHPAPQHVTMLFHTADIFIWGLKHQLGRTRRDLNELKAAGLLCNEVGELAKLGYEHNFGIAADESLLSLAAVPFAFLLARCPHPQALVFHHSYPESASLSGGATEAGLMPHAQYFPAALMREFK